MKLNRLRKWLIHRILKVKATEVEGGVITKTDPTRHEYSVIARTPKTVVLQDEYKVCHTELKYLEREQKQEVLKELKRESVLRLCQEILDKMLFKYEQIKYEDPYLRETEMIRIKINVINPNHNE